MDELKGNPSFFFTLAVARHIYHVNIFWLMLNHMRLRNSSEPLIIQYIQLVKANNS